MLLCVFTPFHLAAQPDWAWADHAGTGSDQRGYDVAADNNGNVFITGYIKGGGNNFDGNLISAVGGDDIFLAKYDAAGNGIWAKAAGGNVDDDGYGVTVDNAGGIYVCGNFSGTATFFGSPNVVLSSVGGKDIFVAKYDASGNVLWAKRAGSNGPGDIAYGICTDGNAVFITGTFSNTASFGALPALVSSGGGDIFIASYDCSTGTENWAVKGGGTAPDEGHEIAVDASGVYVSGFYGNATCTFQNQTGSLLSNGNSDVFLVKYDLGGNGLWTRRAGGSGADQSLSVCVNGGFVYAGGFFNGTMSLYNNGPAVATITSASGDDAFLAQYDATTGNYNWIRSENGSGPDRIYSISSDPAGYVYTTGYFNGTLPMGSGPSVASSQEDVFVTAYNSSGTFQWGRTASGSSMDMAFGISAPDNNSIYVAGFFNNGPTTFGSSTITSFSNDDIFVARLGCITTTSNAGTDQTICSASSSFSGNTAVNGSGSWSLISGTGTITSPSSPTSAVTGLSVGANVFQWTITNGTCPSSSDQVTITRDANPTTANAGTNQNICSASSAFTGNTPTTGTGLWTLISGTGTITTPTSPTSTVTGLSVGANVFQWTTSNGTCPSSSDQVTITRDANPTTANAGLDQTVCSASSTFTGNTPTTGTGLWTLVSGTGTITTPTSPTSAVTGLSVGSNVFQWTISNGTCPSSSDQVTITRDANPTVANAGLDQTICSASSTFTGNTPITGTGLWTLISGTGTITTPSSPTSAVTGLSVGANVFQWTISNGTCPSSSDQVTITRDANPTTANAGLDQTVCSASSTFSGNTPTTGTGLWTLVSGTGLITSPTSPTSAVTGLSVGANVFQWTISNGTCLSSSDQVTITRDANPTTANAGLDQTICSASSAFTGNTPITGTGLWTLISGTGTITTPSSETSAVTGLSVGANVFQWTISNGTCPSSSDQVTITRDANPTTANAGLDQTVCSASSTFSGNAPTTGTGLWTLVSGTGLITSPTSPTSAVTGLSVGANVFQWTISNGTCPASSDQVTITRDANPTVANAGLDQTICSASSTFTGNTPITGTGLWTLVSGTGTITTPTSPTSTVTGLSVCPNVFQWTISNGTCPASSDQVTITRDANPTIANAGTDQTLCASSSVFAANAATIGSGTWSLISGSGTIANPNSESSVVTGLNVGANVFQWTISNGTCPSSSDTVVVNVDANPTTANAGNDQTLCAASSTFSGNTPTTGTGLWTLISGNGTIAVPNSETSAVNNLSTGANVFVWTISNGTCPSSSSDTTIIHVDANPTPANAGLDQTICSSSSAFTGNAALVGNGQWTLLSGSGTIASPNSETSAVSNLSTGANVFEWMISNGTCPSTADTVIINVDANPTTANAGADQVLCASSASFNGNAAVIGTGNWSLLSGAGNIVNSNSETSAVTNLGTGANVFQWLISNGTCPASVDTVVINVDANPTVANAGADQTICSSTSAFAGNAASIGNGTWTLLSGTGNISSPSSATSAVSGLSVGINSFQWMISNGTCPASADTVLINVDANPTTANAGTDQELCASSFTFAANAATVGSGTWSLISGSGTIASPNSETSAVTGMNAGANVFQWTISNGVCPSSSDQIVIQVDANPTTANAGVDRLICEPSDTLNGNIPLVGTGTWYAISNPATFNNPNLPNAIVSNLAVGVNNFEWVITNGVCPASRDTLFVNYTQAPSAALAGTDIYECQNAIVLAAQAPTIGTGYWTNVSGAGIIADTLDPNTAVSSIPDGVYYYTWTTSNSYCLANPDTVAVYIYSPPTPANAGPDQLIHLPFADMHALPVTTGSGSWSLISGAGEIQNTADPETRITHLSPGANVFRWTTSNGVCITTADTITVTCNPLIIPTGYSPNDDGVNDVFEIAGLLEYQDVSLEVFNRWGNKVFTSADYRNDWNGVGDNNQLLPDDVYYYILTLKEGTVFTGYVAIKRTKT